MGLNIAGILLKSSTIVTTAGILGLIGILEIIQRFHDFFICNLAEDVNYAEDQNFQGKEEEC